MGIARGPNLVKDNLVFGYDTGYGVADNNTATRFYPGENTANLFSSPNFTNHTDITVGTTSIVKEDFGDGKIGIRMIQEGTSDIASFSMGSYSAPTSAGTYTWSSFIHSTSTGGKVKAQVTVYVNGTRHWLTNSNTWTTSVTECSHLFIATIANQWHRIENQFTLPTGTLTNLQLGSFYRTTSNFTIKLANAQLELKQHTTPFVDGTRSSTQSLIDLKRTADTDVSNVSFDSTGQPEFDGSNDYVDLGSDVAISPINQGWTAEYVFNTDSASTLQHFNGCEESVHNAGWLALLSSKLAVWDRSANVWKYGSTQFASNTWYHIAFIQESGTSMQFYVNGIAEGGDHASFSWTASKSAFFARYVGKYAHPANNYSRYFNGHIPIAKLYNAPLTAAEIKQNYNAYKNRFNI